MILAILPKRKADSYGSGEYGASRGRRTHKGIDLSCYPGSEILSPVSGTVTKIGCPYADDLEFQYVQVTTEEGWNHRIFYLSPRVIHGATVLAGVTCLGVAQSLFERYPRTEQRPLGMTGHVHYEVIDPDGNYINPETL